MSDNSINAPSAFIQHKGSYLCMDIWCECGENHHIDSDFCYAVRTPCGRVYMVGDSLSLVLAEPGYDGCIQECDPEEGMTR